MCYSFLLFCVGFQERVKKLYMVFVMLSFINLEGLSETYVGLMPIGPTICSDEYKISISKSIGSHIQGQICDLVNDCTLGG